MDDLATISNRFTIVQRLIECSRNNDWDGCMALYSEDFVCELVVYDRPNICFSKRSFRKHFENIPGFRFGKYQLLDVFEGENMVLLHLNTTTVILSTTTPGDTVYEIFLAVHVNSKRDRVTRLQMPTDSKMLAEVKMVSDAA